MSVQLAGGQELSAQLNVMQSLGHNYCSQAFSLSVGICRIPELCTWIIVRCWRRMTAIQYSHAAAPVSGLLIFYLANKLLERVDGY